MGVEAQALVNAVDKRQIEEAARKDAMAVVTASQSLDAQFTAVLGRLVGASADATAEGDAALAARIDDIHAEVTAYRAGIIPLFGTYKTAVGLS